MKLPTGFPGRTKRLRSRRRKLKSLETTKTKPVTARNEVTIVRLRDRSALGSMSLERKSINYLGFFFFF